MRIDTILESTLKNSNLKRVRVKIDPAQLVMQAYHLLDSYEGYVLEECGDSVRVYMMNLPDEFDPVQTVNKQHVSDVSAQDAPSIQKILIQLEKDGVNCDHPVYQKIKKSVTLEFIDSYLSEIGYDDKGKIDFYKRMALHPIAEGIASVLGKAKDVAGKAREIVKGIPDKASELAKGISSSPIIKSGQLASKALGSIAGLAVGKNNIIGRIAKFLTSFDVNDLITASKTHDEKDPTKIQVGTQVYIGDCSAIPELHGIQHYRKLEVEGKRYDLVGSIEKRLFTRDSKSYSINITYPSMVEHSYDIRLSYPEVYNKTKKGEIVFLPKDRDKRPITEEVSVVVSQKTILIRILKEEKKTEVKRGGSLKDRGKDSGAEPSLAVADMAKIALDQDVVKLAVEKSIMQFLNGRSLSDLSLVINTIAGNILRMGEKKGLEIFEETMINLTQDKIANASGDPIKHIRRYLEPVGLYREVA